MLKNFLIVFKEKECLGNIDGTEENNLFQLILLMNNEKCCVCEKKKSTLIDYVVNGYFT
jgi:hypothetical protein